MARALVADAAVFVVLAVTVNAPLSPAALEHVYANGLFAAMNRTFVPLVNAVPFALGDLMVAVLAAALAVWWIRALRRPGPRAARFLAMIAHTAAVGAALAIVFEIAWGWNYRRVPVVMRVDYVATRVDAAAVSRFSDRIGAILNGDVAAAHARAATASPADIRAQLARDFGPVVTRLGDDWPVATSIPKTTISDRLYEAAGVGGQYDPFAFETLLNASFLPYEIPRALAHEWAHVAGFGDEGDANLIGTIACLRSPDPLIRYSGAFWTYDSLPEADRARIHLKPAVVADMAAARARFLRYYNPRLFDLSWLVYDRYLRSNGVQGGIVSYSRFLQLLVGTTFDAGGLPLRSAQFAQRNIRITRAVHHPVARAFHQQRSVGSGNAS